MIALAGIALDFLCYHSVYPGQCGVEVLSQLVSLFLLSCAEQQRHSHSPLSVSCYWHLSFRRRVVAVGFSMGVCCVPVSPNKILFKKQLLARAVAATQGGSEGAGLCPLCSV